MLSGAMGIVMTDRCDWGCGRGKRVTAACPADELALPPSGPLIATSKTAIATAAPISWIVRVRFMFDLPWLRLYFYSTQYALFAALTSGGSPYLEGGDSPFCSGSRHPASSLSQ
jgi:hypothetical protein